MNEKIDQLKQELGKLHEVKEKFSVGPEGSDAEFLNARERVRALREQMVSPLEKKLHLKEQYEFQKQILTDNGFLETLANGELGIVDKDRNEFPFPTYQEIRKRVRENKEMLETKIEQGFTEFVITPFALPLEVLNEKLGETIVRHFNEEKLLATDGTKLELDIDEPVWMWKDFQNQPIVYEPQSFAYDAQTNEFTQTGGKTKDELLSENGGYRLSFLENLPDLPAEGKGKEIGNRKQLEANQTPIAYLNILQTDQGHRHESGLTPEDWVAYFLSHLEKTNTVADDYDTRRGGKGAICWNIGASFLKDGLLPGAYWNRASRHACVGGTDARYPNPLHSTRSRVGI